MNRSTVIFRRQPRAPSRRFQLGVSMIELMVGLTAGLIVIAGVTQVYVANKQTYRLQQAQSRIQEDGRFVLDLLARNVRLAGYKSYSWNVSSVAFPIVAGSGTNPAFGTAGQAVSGLYGSTASADASKLSVRFQGSADGSVQDCLGGSLGANSVAVDTFSVDTKNDTDASNDELQCTASNATSGTTLTQPFISGFGITQIVYGLDTDSPVDKAANRYVSAANVGANWINVVAIRISFMLVSSEDSLLSAAETYTLNGRSYTDRRLRRTYTATIALRNSLP